MAVYYTGRVFRGRGAEERYPPMEKLAFALIIAAYKLRPYFQGTHHRGLDEHTSAEDNEQSKGGWTASFMGNRA